MRTIRVVVIASLAWFAVPGAWPGAAAQPQGRDGQGAAAAHVFAERIDRYDRLRARFEEPLPSFEARRDAWSRLLTRRYLASAIRTARAHAQPGAVFGPPVDAFLRAIIADASSEIPVDGLDGLADDAEGAVDLVVNEPVPEWALRVVPAVLLERLPALPPGIGYRVAGGALLLWDEHAEILIDALPGAFVRE